jgi:small-conductance mechanosensitive channel
MKTYKLLIVVFILTVFPVKAFTALPDIAKAIEPKMHQGSIEEILSFIEERHLQAVQLATEAGTILQQTSGQPEQEALANAVDIFQGIAVKLQRLKAEVKKSSGLGIKPPMLGAPPYSLAIFDGIRSFQKEIDQRLLEYTKDIGRIENKLVIVKKNLESLLFDYTRIRQKDLDKALSFEKAAYIFSLQSEYSLLTLRLSKLRKQLDSLNVLRKEGIELKKTCLKNIHVSADDVAVFKKGLEKASLEQETFLEEMRNETNSLGSKLLFYELQLEKIKEKNGKGKEDNDKKYFLNIEKKRIESIIDTIEIKRRSLEQKKLNLKLNMIVAEFSYYWTNHYAGKDEKRVRDDIQSWRDKQEYLSNTIISLNEELLQASQQKTQFNQKLLMASNDLKALPSQQIKDAISALERQLLKGSELIDVLIATLFDNQNNIRTLSNEISWLLDLLQAEMPWHKNLQVYFEKNFRKSWENIFSVLYYPLFSTGEKNITLATIVKFIILLIVGLMFLRLTRRKVSVLLHTKTRLSFGTVTSITTLVYYVALVTYVFVILSAGGFNLSQFTVIVGAFSVGIGFGLQTIANNFISGIIMLTEQIIKAGDIVNLENGLTGEVKKVAIRSTIIRTVNGDDVIVPNSEFVSGRVNTWTYGDDWRRLTIPFGVSYGADPDEIARLAEEAAREVETTTEDADHPLRIFFEGYGESSLDFSIRVWCRMYRLKALSGLRSDYYFSLFRKLKNAGVTIPFPQRDLNLQSMSPEVLNTLKSLLSKE